MIDSGKFKFHIPKSILLQSILAAATILLYSHSMSFNFLSGWDDNVFVTDNASKFSFSVENVLYWFQSAHAYNYIPLTMLSYMFDYGIWGMNSFGFHLQNVFWHIVVVIALFNCLLLLKLPTSMSFFLSLLFSWHPQRVESVVWISERKDVLCAAFYFLCIFFYMKRRDKYRFDLICFTLFILALLSKSMAVSIPFIFMAYEAYIQRKLDLRNLFFRLWPYCLLVAVFTPVTYLAQLMPESHQQFIFSRRIFSSCYNYMWYFEKTLLPLGLCPIYPKTEMSILVFTKTAVFYSSFLILMAYFFKRHRDIFLFKVLPLLTCYVFSLAPVCGILTLRAIDRADRYSYIPSTFIILGLGALLLSAFSRTDYQTQAESKTYAIIGRIRCYKIFSILLPAFIIILLGAYNFAYSFTFKDMYSLVSKASLHNPPNPIALGTLSGFEIKNGNFQKAEILAETLAALDGSELSPDSIKGNRLKAELLRGHICFRTGRKTEALDIFLKIKPQLKGTTFCTKEDYVSLLGLTADCYLQLGRTSDAVEAYKEILSGLDNDCYDYFFYGGLLKYFSGDYPGALVEFEKALKYSPEDTMLKSNIKECKNKINMR